LTPGLAERGAACSGRQGAVLAVLAMLAAEEAAARGSARLRASLDGRSTRRREVGRLGRRNGVLAELRNGFRTSERSLGFTLSRIWFALRPVSRPGCGVLDSFF